MKLKKVKSSDVSAGLVNIGGAGLGFMSANGLANAYAKVDDEAVMTDEQKKKKLHVAIGCVILGSALAIAVDGNDLMTMGAKAVGTGLAGGGIKGVIAHFAKNDAQALAPATATKRFVAGALGCPCENQTTIPARQTYSPALARPSLRSVMPSYGTENQMKTTGVYDTFSLS